MNVEQEYKEYQKRRAECYPERKELSIEEFAVLINRWQKEYHNAWDNLDMATIEELETALCV